MVSIILLSYYSGERIITAYDKLSVIMKAENIPFELIIIDDGSDDNSYSIALELESRNTGVKAFQLSRNYSSSYAAFAGLSKCEGGCAVLIPDDEQQPYDTIVKMYRLWQNGEKVIIPYREKRDDGFIDSLAANTYYSIINTLSEIKFPRGGADIFFIDRELIDILNKRIHPINTSIITEVLRLGFGPYFFPYKRVRGINTKSRWTLKKKIRLFKDTFFSSSTWPVKMITRIGLFFSFAAFCFIIFYVYIALFGNSDYWGEKLPGWTSTVIIIAFFSGLNLFSIGILAEYIWRIYEEVKNRPGYIIKKKDNEDLK